MSLFGSSWIGLISRMKRLSVWYAECSHRPFRLDDHARVAALRERVDGQHRRAEIGDIDAPFQIARQRRLEEIDDQRLALLPDVDAGGVVRQVDDKAPFAIATATEVDVAQRVLHLSGLGFGKTLHGIGSRPDGFLVVERHDHRVAFEIGLEGLRLVEIEHHAGAIAGLDHVQAAQRGFVDRPLGRAQSVDRIEEIERDARRALDREAGRRIGRRILELKAHDDAAGTCARDRDAVDAVRLLRERDRRQAKCVQRGKRGREASSPRHRRTEKSIADGRAHFLPWGLASACCNCSVLERSVQSPAPSCTSSFNLTSPSPMPVTTPKFCPT